VSPSRKRDQEAARSNRSECPSYRSKKKGCAPRRRRLGRHLGGALRQRGLGRRLGGALRQRHLGWCHLCAARVSVPPPGAALSVGVAPMRRVGTAWGGASAARCVSAASSVSWLVVVSFCLFWRGVVALPLCSARRGGCVAVCLGGRCVSCLGAGGGGGWRWRSLQRRPAKFLRASYRRAPLLRCTAAGWMLSCSSAVAELR
jgi:hypothetical protein